MKQMKRAISMLLVLAIIVSNCPIAAFATSNETALEGVNLGVLGYEDYQYTMLSDGTISIYGYGNIPSDDTEGTYLEIPPSINDVPVTQIATNAFAENSYIDSVLLPDTITFVGDSAFANCEDIKAIAFGGDIPELGTALLAGCNSLKHLYVLSNNDLDPLNEQLIDANLENVSVLEYEKIEDLETAYNEYIASLDAELQAMELPVDTAEESTLETSVPSAPSEEIEATADGNEITTNVTTGSTEEATELSEETTESTEHTIATEPTVEVTEPVNQEASNAATATSTATDFLYAILNGTYCEITGYIGTDTELNIPSEIDGYIVQSIAGSAFKDNTTLTTVVFPETIETIGTYVFSGCTALADVRLNNGLTNIGGYTFNGCTALASLTIPSTVKSIGEYAFSGCTGLTQVNLSEGLTTIYRYAFQNCTSLVSIDLPDSITTMAARAFYNCTKLAEVGYPAGWTTVLDYSRQSSTYYGDGDSYYTSPFQGCTALKKIEIDEGVTGIPKHAFRYVTALEEVVLPDSLTTIGVYAFDECTKLRTINLVEGITEIPAYCFYNCTGMNYLTLPDTLETAGDHAFYNCKGLRSISMGSELKTIGRYAFYGCQGLVSLFVGGNVETISEYAFAECINIKSITLPTKLVTIGDAAFANCAKVTDLNVPNSVTSIADNAFSGLTDLIFYCSMNSYAATYAIDHNIPIIDTEERTDDSLYIDRETSYYRVNGDGVSASGYLVMVAKYDFLDSVTATNINLTFNIPSAVELDESTLTVDGVLCTDYTFEDSVLTVPVSNTSGAVRFLLKPLNYDRVTAYCKVSFNDGSTSRTEIVGTIYTEIPILSITSPAQTSSTSVRVSGVTIPNSNVTLYVNGSEYTTVQANKVGDYSATIQFTSPSNGKKYTIRAKVVDSTGATVTAETSTTYRVSVPVLTHFIMEYGGKTYNLHELVGTKPNITWASSYQYKFTVRFKNVESVSSVYIVSTRNNVKKYMQAQWDEVAQAFIAEGFFDSNSSYVPGIISVEYVRSNGDISFADGYDFSSEEAYNEVPKQWQDGNVTILENTDERTEVIIERNEDSIPSEGGDEAVRVVTEKHKIDNISDDTAESLGYSKVTDNNGQYVYAKVYSKDGKYWASVVDSKTGDAVDIAADLVTQFVKDDGTVGYKVINALGDVGDFLDLFSIGIEGSVNTLEYGRMKQDILNSNLSAADKNKALEKLNDSIVTNTLASLVRIEMVLAGAIMLPGAAVFGPVGVIAFLGLIKLADVAASQLQEITMLQMNDMMYRLLAMGFTWAIDPSGFVYDTETGLPILEATVTAYWIPYDENDADYWNETPSAEEYGEVWDSSGFGQENPLTTDISGWYAWDVPEGWWRVKSERFGYETTWSDWVPVPPPQMDVHIGMTPLDNCGYCGKDVIWIIDEAGILTISGIGDMADYTADVAAPWSEAASDVTKVVIEDGVTSIGSYAFNGCTNLASIEIASTVESIDANAFKGCTALTEIIIGENIDAIGDYAFSGCTSLSKVTFEGTAPTIGTGTFQQVTATAYYPGDDTSWTSEVMQDYGGIITWRPITDHGHEHSYDSVVTAPTCTEQGYTTYTCACGDSYVADYVDALGHTEETIPGTAATCTESGLTDGIKCSVCGEVLTAQEEISALGHTWDEGAVTKEPTEDSEGEKTYTCTICGETRTETIPALGHEHSYSSTVTNPTCTEQGYTTHTCSCGDSYVDTYTDALGHNYSDGTCTRCGEADPDYVEPKPDDPALSGVIRIAGSDRIATSLMLADQLKEVLRIEKFDAVVVASALNFPDALTGSYLAAEKKAPILLTYPAAHAKIRSYIQENLKAGGMVYILGGEGAVSADFANGLNSFNIKRLAGSDRFGTNLEIMKEAGNYDGKPVLIATATNFADSLSASAADLPMVLVYGSLRADQKEFLATTSRSFIIIGGEAAVSKSLENELAAIGSVTRVAGSSRYETSVLVAERFVQNPDAVILAYAKNFPDGLCGGPLAYALGAPLILTDSGAPGTADAYVEKITAGIVVGGSGLISDAAAREIFDLAANAEIQTK